MKKLLCASLALLMLLIAPGCAKKQAAAAFRNACADRFPHARADGGDGGHRSQRNRRGGLLF